MADHQLLSRQKGSFRPISPTPAGAPGAKAISGARHDDVRGRSAYWPGSAPRKEQGDGKRRVSIIIICGTITVVIAVAIIAAFALPSAFRARVVEVHGNATLGAAEVVAASLIVPGSPLFSNEATRIEAALAAWPPVSSAKASLVLPDRIRLDIVERKPVALAIAEAEGRNVLVAIDGTGMAYARVEGATLPELPVLSGIRFEEWKAGQRLPDFLLPTLESLATLESGDPGLLSLFSEIRVERSSFGELELILFPLHHPLPVRTKAALDPALLRSIVLILDALSTGGLAANVVELDFRTGTIVFRTKEGQPG